MKSPEFDEFCSVNDQLVDLAPLGVAFDLQLGRSETDVAQRLQWINAEVARRINQGASLDEALAGIDRPDCHRYASTMRYGLRTGNWTRALEQSHHLAHADEVAGRVLRAGLSYPLLVCTLAYLGLVGFCLYLVPLLRSTYANLGQPTGRWLGLLDWLSMHTLYWAWIPPLVLLIVWRAVGPSSLPLRRRVPSVEWERRAKFADVLADLLAHEVPADVAVPIAQGMCGAGPRSQQSHWFSAGGGRRPAELSSYARWVVHGVRQPSDQAAALRAAAASYREFATRSAARRQRAATLIPCVLLGGGAALLYALALFLPVIELLHSLALPSALTVDVPQ